MRVLAFDPGETTGYAIVEYAVTERSAQIHILQVGTFSGAAELYALTLPGSSTPWDYPRPDTSPSIFDGIEQVVIEDYIIYPNRARSHIGSKVYTAREIGRIEYAAYPFGLTMESGSIVMQTASMAKQRWPTSRLKNYLAPLPHYVMGSHEVDAIRHAFTWIERTFKKPFEVV